MDITLIHLCYSGCFLLLAGYLLPRISNKVTARATGWMIGATAFVFSVWITQDQAPLYRMVSITTLQLLAMKNLVMLETYSGKPTLTFIQWCTFDVGWFGMRPALFEKLTSESLSYSYFLITGLSRILIGIVLLYGSLKAETLSIYFLPELLLLAGLSMILHFGILNLATGLWRFLGVDVKELFRSPYKARSLQEFWGKRWNMAFSEMTALIVYKPLKNKLGASTAMTLSFLVSGILHEFAISFPVNSGFGLPLLYFSIHGTLMYAEKKSMIIKNITTHRILSHVWVMSWLVLPIPLLFHHDFIALVLKPLRSDILHLVFR